MKVKCQVCGNYVDYDPNNPYCPNCGATLQPPSQQPAPPTDFAVVYAVMPNGEKKEVLRLLPAEEHALGRSDLYSYAWRDPETITRREQGRYHLKIKYEGGKIYVADDHSTNGTYIDGNDIRGKGYVEVPPGKEIILVNPKNPVVKLVFEKQQATP